MTFNRWWGLMLNSSSEIKAWNTYKIINNNNKKNNNKKSKRRNIRKKQWLIRHCKRQGQNGFSPNNVTGRGEFSGRHHHGNPSREWPTSLCFPWISLKLEDSAEDNKSITCKTSQQSCGSGRVQSHRMLVSVVVSAPTLALKALVLSWSWGD